MREPASHPMQPKMKKAKLEASSSSSSSLTTSLTSPFPASPLFLDAAKTDLMHRFLALAEQVKLLPQGCYASNSHDATELYHLSIEKGGLISLRCRSQTTLALEAVTKSTQNAFAQELAQLKKQDLSTQQNKASEGQRKLIQEMEETAHKEVETETEILSTSISFRTESKKENQLTKTQIPLRNSLLYMVGGKVLSDALNTVECYDSNKRVWRTVAPMRNKRNLCSAKVLNGQLYVAGGMSDYDSYSCLASVEKYDAKTDSWYDIPRMHEKRSACTTAVLHGRLYVMGGRSPTSRLSSVERYNPSDNSWEQVCSMRVERSAGAAAVLCGTLYVVGGLDKSQELLSCSTMERYDSTTDQWEWTANMKSTRFGHAALPLGGFLYVIGGYQDASVERYNPKTNEWTTVASMHSPRAYFASAAMDGMLYVMGGTCEEGCLSSVERYDPATNTWSLVHPELSSERHGCAAAILLSPLSPASSS
eukprot:gb/GEZN01003331.1/.p1 GENE.gb/GEZN01003331.1/~~gb/GEZN01003331.1/.p1  ORF type:complete len:485 (+),score=68.48 gb/GEZN01003331.1/:24-1457(+)